jgi:hypothetical protein
MQHCIEHDGDKDKAMRELGDQTRIRIESDMAVV